MNRKTVIIGLATATVAVLAYALYVQVIQPILNDRTVTTVIPMTVRSSVSPLKFTYPSGEFGYTLIEPPVASTSPDGLQKVYLIMNNQAYLAFQAKEESTETPPTVSVFIFKNPERAKGTERVGYVTRLQTWADQHPQYSSFPLIKTEPEVVEFDGLPTLRYRTEGLYQQEVNIASYRGYTLVITGQFKAETDEIYTMYTELMQSLIFN